MLHMPDCICIPLPVLIHWKRDANPMTVGDDKSTQQIRAKEGARSF